MRKTDFLARLRKARDLIARGWAQGIYRTEGGCYCAVGALKQVGIDYEFRFQRHDGCHEDPGMLLHWNDEVGRTQKEVVAMFDNSIAALEARLAVPSGRNAE